MPNPNRAKCKLSYPVKRTELYRTRIVREVEHASLRADKKNWDMVGSESGTCSLVVKQLFARSLSGRRELHTI